MAFAVSWMGFLGHVGEEVLVYLRISWMISFCMYVYRIGVDKGPRQTVKTERCSREKPEE